MKKFIKKLKKKYYLLFCLIFFAVAICVTHHVFFLKKIPPKVSVVIPVYNTAPYLKRCLDSVTHQTLKNIEIICINDGSTDNSLKILNEYAQKDKRISVIDLKENKGVATARNTGILRANGTFIGFVDSDDFIDEKHFENLYRHRGKADVIKGIVLRNGNLLPDKKYGQIIGMMVRRKFLIKKNVIFPLKRRGEDRAFYKKLKKKKARVKFLKDNGIYYHYEYRVGSAMNWKQKDFVCKNGDVPKVF